MRAYAAVMGARFRMLLQYRAAAFAGLATQIFWGLIILMVYEAFYHSGRHTQPMTYQQVVVYVWLGQAMLAMLPWNIDTEVRDMIRSGTIVYEMLRPLDLYWLIFTRAIALRSAPTLLRAVPMFIIAGIFFGMKLPNSPASGAAWAIATVGALLLSAAITTLITMSLLWTISGDGVARLVPAAVMIFSGMLLPLPFFPKWAQPVINFMPFRGLTDTPFRLYIGHIPPQHAMYVITQQLIWIVVLIMLGRLLVARGVHKLVVQGG